VLTDARSGRHLIEDHPLVIAPSASVYLAARTRARHLSALPHSALVVGASQPDSSSLAPMGSLPDAEAETRQVAELYERADLRLGSDATRRSLLDELPEQDVFHFSGHATPNETVPRWAYLALARSGPAGDGALTAEEIARLELPRTRVVVLAACATAVGPVSAHEGALSLARAFLAARVPAVVASFWPVGDRQTTPLILALHARLRRGDDPARALRGAQLELLRGGDLALRSPAVWGAFGSFGS
jgi:CHAT domain-containing protein